MPYTAPPCWGGGGGTTDTAERVADMAQYYITLKRLFLRRVGGTELKICTQEAVALDELGQHFMA